MCTPRAARAPHSHAAWRPALTVCHAGSPLPSPPSPARQPCYRILCLAIPETPAPKLAEIFRGCARVVYREKGQFRTVENLGVRPLHWPFRFAGKKYDDARWVQFWADLSPAGLASLRGFIAAEEAILMATPLRARADLGEELGEFRPHRKSQSKRKSSRALPAATAAIKELLQ